LLLIDASFFHLCLLTCLVPMYVPYRPSPSCTRSYGCILIGFRALNIFLIIVSTFLIDLVLCCLIYACDSCCGCSRHRYRNLYTERTDKAVKATIKLVRTIRKKRRKVGSVEQQKFDWLSFVCWY
jgi:hypothetical protein